MNILAAKSLIQTLAHVHIPGHSIKDELSGLFIPTLLGKEVILKSSLRGRIASFFSQRESPKKQVEQIRQVFAQAIQTLYLQKNGLKGVSLPIVLELTEALRDEKFILDFFKENKIPANAELDQLKSKAVKKEKILKKHILKNSLLHSSPLLKKEISSKVMQSLIKGELTPETLDYLNQFFESSPDFSPENYRDLFSLLGKGNEFVQKSQHSFLENEKDIATLSQECMDHVRNLKPGEKWLFRGNYGQRIGSLNNLFKLLQLLPEDVKKNLPKPFPNLLTQQSLPEPIQFAKDAIHESLKELSPILPGIEKILGHPFLTPLLADESRTLPRILAEILPVCIGSPIEKWLKEGILKQVAAFVPDDHLSDIIDWVASNKGTLTSPEKRARALDELESRIANCFKKPADSGMQQLDTAVFNLFQSIQKTISPSILEATGLDVFVASGALWIEFEKTSEDRIVINIYASGPALAHHDQNKESEIAWPLKIPGILAHKFDSVFFQRLLYHTLEPLKNPDAVSRADNIYEGLVQHLGSIPAVMQKRQKLEKASKCLTNDLAVAMGFLLKTGELINKAFLTMRLNALVQYSRQYIDNPNHLLELTDPDAVNTLESSMEILWKDVLAIKKELDGDLLAAIESMREEILSAVSVFREKELRKNIVLPDHALVIPRPLLDQLKTALHRSGFSTQTIRNAKHTLCYALGSEMENLIDALAESLDSIPLPPNAPDSISHKHGWLREVISSFYAQIAYQALQASWFAYKLYTGEATVFLILSWTHWGIKKVLPRPYYDWYVIVIDTVTQELCKAILYLTLRCMFSGSELEQFQSIAENWKHLLHNWKSTLNASQKIHFGFERKILGDRIVLQITDQSSKIPLESKEKKESECTHIHHIPLKYYDSPDEAVSAILSHTLKSDEQPTLENFLPLLSIAENLSLPSITSSSCWDKLKNPEAALKALTQLSINLHNGLPHAVKTPGMISRTVIAMYTVLAISNHLARQYKETGLRYQPINAYPLLAFIKGHGALLDNPFLQSRLRNLCSYFMPDVNVDNLQDDPYADPEILKKAQDSLFDYSKAFSIKYMIKPENFPEAKYLQNFLNDPKMSSQLEAIGMPPGSKQMTKLNVLFNESLVFGREKPLLPIAFSQLKLQTLLSNRLVTLIGSEHDWEKLTPWIEKAPPPPEEYQTLKFDPSLRELYELMTKPCGNEIIPKQHPQKDNSFFLNNSIWKAFKSGIKTQSEIIISSKGKLPLSKEESPEMDEISKAFELIFVEKEDQVIRFLDFFSKYGSELPEDPLMDGLYESLEAPFFSFNNLENQLKRSPQTAALLATFLNREFERQFKLNRTKCCFWLINLGIRIKPFIDKFAPVYAPQFPHFRSQLERLIPKHHEHCTPSIGIALQLLSMTYPNNPAEMTAAEKKNMVFALVRAYFYPVKDYEKKDNPFHLIEFSQLYSQWIPEIDRFFKENDASELCKSVLRDRGIEMRDSAKPDSKGKSTISWGPFEFKLQDGRIESSRSFNYDTYNQVQEKISQICPEAHLIINPDKCTSRISAYKTYSDFIDIEVFADLDDKTLSIFQNRKGKRYKFVDFSLPDELLPFVNDKSQLENAFCWLEENSRNQKDLYVACPDGTTFTILTEQKPFKILKISQNNSTFEPIPSAQTAYSLSPFIRFCPLSKIYCWAKPGKNILDTVFLEPFNIKFKVTEQNGQLTGECVSHFPNYHTAPQQIHPALEGFSSYLLLENGNGDNKVFLPDGQWLSSGIAGLMPQAELEGSMARAFEKWMGSIQQKNIEGKQLFYVYDIDANGHLACDDPQALIYLMCLYMLQKKDDLAESTCDELLRLYKSTTCEADLGSVLLPLSLVPSPVSSACRIRRKIFAAIQESKTLRPNFEKEKLALLDDRHHHGIKKELFESLIFSFACLSDLTDNHALSQTHLKLSETAEWYLYNHLFYHLKNLFQNGLEVSSSLIDNLNSIGWEYFLYGIDKPDLVERYRDLNAKFGSEPGILKKAVQSSIHAILTPTSVPKFFTPGTMLPKMGHSAMEFAHAAALGRIDSTKILDIKKLHSLMQPEETANPVFIFEGSTEENRDTFKRYFLTYYSIARGERSAEELSKLKEMTATNKGGWDQPSSLLISYLDSIAYSDKAKSSPETKELKAALSLKTDKEESLKQTIEFFGKVNVWTASLGCVNSIFKLFSCLKGREVVSLFAEEALGIGYRVLKGAEKFYDAATAEEPKKEEPLPPPSYDCLAEEDQIFDQTLDRLFEIAFEKVTVPSSDAKVEHMHPEHELTTEKVNASLDAFYTAKGNFDSLYNFKGKDALWHLHEALIGYRKTAKALVKKQEKSLLEIVNKKNGPKITLDTLKKSLLEDKFSELGKELGFDTAEIAQLEIAFMRNAVLKTRLNQLNRIKARLKEISAMAPKKQRFKNDLQELAEKMRYSREQRPQYLDALSELADEIKARRAYKFNETPQRLTRRYVFFELLSNTLIWEKQAKPILDLLAGNVVVEQQMGTGKTTFTIPTINSYLADGSNIVFNSWPDSLAETNTRGISKQGKLLYGQKTNILRITRKSKRNLEQLQAVNVLLTQAMQNRETISILPSEAQTLESNLIDLLFLSKRTDDSDEKLMESLKLHNAALALIQNNGFLVGDEAHEQLKYQRELNYPAGPAYTISKSYYTVMELCLRSLAQKDIPLFLQSVRDNDLENLHGYWDEIVQKASQSLSNAWIFQLNDETQKKEFAAYVSGKCEKIPEWIQKSEKFDEIAMVKGTFTTLLPFLFDQKIDVNYGLTEKGDAGPFAGNKNPHEKYSIQSPYEKLVKTFVSYLHKGLDQNQALALLDKLYALAKSEADKRGIDFTLTIAGLAMNSMLSSKPELLELVKSGKYIDNRNVIAAEILDNPDAAFYYVRFFVSQNIRYWKQCIRNNAQNFVSAFHKAVFGTGTPYNDKTYHRTLKMLRSPETTGEVLHLLNKKSSKDPIDILKSKKSKEILQEAISTYFKPGSSYSMLVDGDAQLTGIDGDTVASEILSHCKAHRPDIKAVVYFKRLNGKDQLVCKEIGSQEAYPFDQCKLSPDKYISYIGDGYDFGTNVPTKGSSIILVGKQPFYRWLQQIFRLRNIKKFRKLISKGKFGEFLKASESSTQKVHFAMTESVRDKINPKDKIPTLRELIEYTMHRETEIVKKDNYFSCRKKIHDVVRSAIMKKFKEKTVPELVCAYPEFEDFLVPTIEDRPSKLFAYTQADISPQEVIPIAKTSAYNVIKNSDFFTSTEKELIEKTLNELPCDYDAMPDTVKVFKNGDEIHTSTLDDLDFNLNIDEDEELEHNAEQNIDTQTNVDVQTSANDQASYSELEWPKEEKYSSLDWINFQSAHIRGKASRLFSSGLDLFSFRSSSIPSLFQFTDALKHASHHAIRSLSQSCDTRLWFTNNFMPRVLKGIIGEPVEAGSKHQRDLFEVLVVLKKVGSSYQVHSIGALSQHDADFWRNRLASKTATSNEEIKMVLYDVPTRTIVAGKHDEKALKEDKVFRSLEAQLKFLNGDTQYHPDLIEPLKTWLELQDVKALRDAFFTIHDQRNVLSASGTEIDHLFNDLLQVPLEYRI